jgi:hypothetical protein
MHYHKGLQFAHEAGHVLGSSVMATPSIILDMYSNPLA